MSLTTLSPELITFKKTSDISGLIEVEPGVNLAQISQSVLSLMVDYPVLAVSGIELDPQHGVFDECTSLGRPLPRCGFDSDELLPQEAMFYVRDIRRNDDTPQDEGSFRPHFDNSFDPRVHPHIAMHTSQMPISGGDTVFIDTAKAYDEVLEEFGPEVESLKIEHSLNFIVGQLQDDTVSPSIEDIEDETDTVNVVPLIREPFNTKVKSVYSSPLSSARIIGVEPERSRVMINTINEIILGNPEAQVVHKWQPNQLLIVDNVRVLHNATRTSVGERTLQAASFSV